MASDLTVIGWTHLALGAYALVAGAHILLGPKGGSRHRTIGRRYALATALVSLSAFGIYGSGRFSVFHWMAVATLVSLALAFIAAQRQHRGGLWLRLHLTGFLVSYYMLLGGTLNQAFLRIPFLSSMDRQALGIAIATGHSLLIVTALMVIAYFWGRTSAAAPLPLPRPLTTKSLAAIAAVGVAMPWTSDASAAEVEVVVQDVRSDAGEVLVQLCRQQEYLRTQCSFVARSPARKGNIVFRFDDVPAGAWAITSFHDENRNGKLDSNFLGIPTEGYGFSRDAQGWFGPAKFDDAGFDVCEQPSRQTLRMHY